jgi:hypothetical protein
MKKVKLLIILLIAFISFSCDQDKETEVPEPKGIFFRGTIDGHKRTIADGVNGYVVKYHDTCYVIDSFNYYEPIMILSQESQNYYVSSKEAISFTFKDLFLFHDSITNKDSMLGAYLYNHKLIPIYSNASSNGSLIMGGLDIMWRDAEGREWFTGLGAQNSIATIDTLVIVRKPGMISEYNMYITFDCKLYTLGASISKEIKDAHARISIKNTCFY